MTILDDETTNFTTYKFGDEEPEFEYREESVEFVDQYGSQYTINFGQQLFD